MDGPAGYVREKRTTSLTLLKDFSMSTLNVISALGNRHRLKLIEIISGQDNEGITVEAATILLGIKQPTVSHHLSELKDVGLVTCQSSSYYHIYRVDTTKLKELVSFLREIILNCEKD